MNSKEENYEGFCPNNLHEFGLRGVRKEVGGGGGGGLRSANVRVGLRPRTTVIEVYLIWKNPFANKKYRCFR